MARGLRLSLMLALLVVPGMALQPVLEAMQFPAGRPPPWRSKAMKSRAGKPPPSKAMPAECPSHSTLLKNRMVIDSAILCSEFCVPEEGCPDAATKWEVNYYGIVPTAEGSCAEDGYTELAQGPFAVTGPCAGASMRTFKRFGDPAGPPQRAPAAPIREPAGPTAPGMEEPAAPITEDPMLPITEEPAAPIPRKPFVPIRERPAAPIPKQPFVPITEEPAAPIPRKPLVPITEEPAAPIPKQPFVPIDARTGAPFGVPAAPIMEEPAAPITRKPFVPIFGYPAAPIPREPAAPIGEPAAPIMEDPQVPVTEEPAAPTPREPAAPIPREPAAPVGVPAPGRHCPADTTPYQHIKKGVVPHGVNSSALDTCSTYCVPEGPCLGLVQLGTLDWEFGISAEGQCDERAFPEPTPVSGAMRDLIDNTHGRACNGMAVHTFGRAGSPEAGRTCGPGHHPFKAVKKYPDGVSTQCTTYCVPEGSCYNIVTRGASRLDITAAGACAPQDFPRPVLLSNWTLGLLKSSLTGSCSGLTMHRFETGPLGPELA